MKDNKKEEVSIENKFNKIRSILKQQKSNGYNEFYIKGKLHDNLNLRKVFLATIKTYPSRISEIYEESLLSKPTCYNHLFLLLDLKLVERIFIVDIIDNKIKNDEIKEKFEEWTENMPPTLKRYYLAKTSYWIITEFGKGFAEVAYQFDQEFREKGFREKGKKEEEHGNL